MSADRRVVCRSLEVQVAPGVPAGRGFTLRDLDGGVVVIHGPNASGKTTTARALLSLFTPADTAPAGFVVEGVFHQAKTVWRLRREYGHLAVERDGQPAPAGDLAPGDLGLRYLISLPELFLEQDADLAAAMVRTAQGGFDPASLGKVDPFRVPTRPQGLRRQLEEAEQAVRKAQAHQQELLVEEREQARRREELAALATELAVKDLVAAARERQKKRAELAALAASLAEYPPAMARLQGDEGERLAELDADIAEQERRREELRRQVRQAEADLAAARVPDLDAARQTLTRAKGLLEELRQVERDLNGAASRRAQAAGKERELAARLGSLADPGLPARLAAGEPSPLDDFHREAVATAAEREALARWRDRLAATASAGRSGRLVLVLLAATVAGATGWGAFHSWPAAVGAALLAAGTAWFVVRAAGDAGRRWERSELARRESRLAEREQSLAERRRALEAELDVSLPAADPWLPVVVDNLVAWQRARTEMAAAQNEETVLQDRRARLLRDMANLLVPHDEPAPESTTVAAAILDDLRDRVQAAEVAARSLAAARQERQAVASTLARLQERRRNLLADLDLAEGREGLLRQWLERLPEYRKLTADIDHLERQIADLDAELKDRPDLRDADLPSLDRRLEELERLEEQERALVEEIAGVDGRIAEAKRGRELLDALAERDRLRDALSRERERAAAGAVGATLLDWLHRRVLERSRPAVFRRAEALLAAFTRGTLRLELAPDGGGFRAVGSDGVPRDLATLSAGERAQFLLAVRLAFLQEHEPAPLPLLLDEVLGTSDERRAAAVVEAVAALSRERQVLVFTAQPDEAARWREGLRAAGLPPPQVIDLAEIRKLAEAAPPGRLRRSSGPPAVPAPAPGEEMAAYGARLRVPRLDPRAPVADAYLWYLLDDPAVLHDLLRLGIATWGQLQTMRQTGNIVEAPWYPAAAAAARALAAASEAWREGRGRPVDRAVLAASGAVSSTFLDRVAETAAAGGGDAAKLLDALAAGKVPRWRQEKTGELRHYLEQEGYLDPRPVLDAPALRARVMGAVHADLQAGTLSSIVVERLLAALPDVPPGAADTGAAGAVSG